VVGQSANNFVISFRDENFIIRIMRRGNHGADYLATLRYNAAGEPTGQQQKEKYN
jgi:hypothetical protein